MPKKDRPTQTSLLRNEGEANTDQAAVKSTSAHGGPTQPATTSISSVSDNAILPSDSGDSGNEVEEEMLLAPEDQEIFIPVHGFVMLTAAEVQILNHPALQRLGHVFQLGQSHLHFRGATHMRLEHAIGTVAVAQQMIDAIGENASRPHPRRGRGAIENLGRPFTDDEAAFVRLAALLHDVGHLPAGHTLEDELCLLDKHDSMHRLELVFDETRWPSGATVSLRELINRVYASHAEGCGLTADQVVIRIIAKDSPTTPAIPEDAIRIGVCRDIVGNTICADLLDYLHRDWHHVGKPKYFERRLYQYMEIRSDEARPDRFVISLGRRPRIRTDAVSAILELLEWRYHLAEIVYFHRTKCAAAAMLERGIQEIAAHEIAEGRNWINDLELALLNLSDLGMLDYLLDLSAPAPAARRPLAALRGRRIYKAVYTRFWGEFPGGDPRRAADLYATKTPLDAEEEAELLRLNHEAASNRLAAVSLLEEDFGLDYGSLAIYCPDRWMNSKIAGVNICVDGAVAKLNKWEEQNGDTLSGGHLAAQQDRFRRLWRFHVFMERGQYESLVAARDPILPLLQQAIDQLVLGIMVDQITVQDASMLLANQLQRDPGTGRMAARDRDTLSRVPRYAREYPTGAPSLRSTEGLE